MIKRVVDSVTLLEEDFPKLTLFSRALSREQLSSSKDNLYSILCSEDLPVKGMKHRTDMGRSGCSENKSCSIESLYMSRMNNFGQIYLGSKVSTNHNELVLVEAV